MTVKDYTKALTIHVTDLQQLADHFKYTLPHEVWARMQGALNGLRDAMSRAEREEAP